MYEVLLCQCFQVGAYPNFSSHYNNRYVPCWEDSTLDFGGCTPDAGNLAPRFGCFKKQCPALVVPYMVWGFGFGFRVDLAFEGCQLGWGRVSYVGCAESVAGFCHSRL